MSTTERNITYKGEQGSYRFYVNGTLRGHVASQPGGRWGACNVSRTIHADHLWTRADAVASVLDQWDRKSDAAAARRAAKNAN